MTAQRSAQLPPFRTVGRRAGASVATVALIVLTVASCSSKTSTAADSAANKERDENYVSAPADAGAAQGLANKVPAPASPVSTDGRSAAAAGGTSGEIADAVVVGLGPVPSGRQIIATADLSIRAKDVVAAAAQVRSFVLGARGYVENEQSSATPGFDEKGRPISIQSNVTLQLRVPTASFDNALKKLGSVGVVVSRSLGAQDVTSEVVDVNSRVISAKASIARMQVLFDKAQSIADIASIEGELSRRQADLESLLARQKELANLTSLATISVSIFSGDAPVAIAAKSTVRRALDDAVGALGNGAKAILVAAAAVLPFALLALVLAFPIRGLVRHFRRNHKSASPVAPLPTPSGSGETAA